MKLCLGDIPTCQFSQLTSNDVNKLKVQDLGVHEWKIKDNKVLVGLSFFMTCGTHTIHSTLNQTALQTDIGGPSHTLIPTHHSTSLQVHTHIATGYYSY